MRRQTGFLLALFILAILSSTQLNAQSKKELKDSLNKAQKVNDSLTKEIVLLTANLDSLTTIMGKAPIGKDSIVVDSLFLQQSHYETTFPFMYQKYIHPILTEDTMNLTVTQLSTRLDDRVKMDILQMDTLKTEIGNLKDTINQLGKDNTVLHAKMEVYNDIISELAGKSQYPNTEADLNGNWQLILKPLVISGESPKAALVSLEQTAMSDTLINAIIRSVSFGADNFAELQFMGGKKIKCFYAVEDFSTTKTYYINFDRGKEISIRLFVTHGENGLQISYEIPGKSGKPLYLFGFMKR